MFPRGSCPADRTEYRLHGLAMGAGCFPSTKHPQNKNDAKKKTQIEKKKL
jgi:hypothetical protein